MSGYNEEAYRDAREAAITLACPFERALLAHCAECRKANKILLAEREAIACTEAAANARCRRFHATLHQSARFALRLDGGQPWPFGKEIRAQCGGALGLAGLLEARADYDALLEAAERRWGSIEALPYSELMPAVMHFEPRHRR